MVGTQRMNNPKILLYPARGFELVFAQSLSEFTGLNSRDRKRVHFQWCMGSVSLPGPPCHHLQSKPLLTLPACWKEIGTLKSPPISIVEKQNLNFLYSYNLGACPLPAPWAEAREGRSPGQQPGPSAWPAGTVLQRGSLVQASRWMSPSRGDQLQTGKPCALSREAWDGGCHSWREAGADGRPGQPRGSMRQVLPGQRTLPFQWISPRAPFWHGIFPGL